MRDPPRLTPGTDGACSTARPRPRALMASSTLGCPVEYPLLFPPLMVVGLQSEQQTHGLDFWGVADRGRWERELTFDLLGSLGRALARALAIFASHTERWRWPIPTGTGTAKVSKMGAFRRQVVLARSCADRWYRVAVRSDAGGPGTSAADRLDFAEGLAHSDARERGINGDSLSPLNRKASSYSKSLSSLDKKERRWWSFKKISRDFYSCSVSSGFGLPRLPVRGKKCRVGWGEE